MSPSSGSLKSDRRFSEACRVFLDYAEDVEEGVVALLEGLLWEEALRLLHLHHRCDLLETHLLPGLLEAHASHLSLFESLLADFKQHSSRLLVVRDTKRQKQAAILGIIMSKLASNICIILHFVVVVVVAEGTYAADEKDADLFSDTSSVTGQSAVSSLNTSLRTSQYSKATG